MGGKKACVGVGVNGAFGQASPECRVERQSKRSITTKQKGQSVNNKSMVRAGYQMSLFTPTEAVGEKLGKVIMTKENKAGAQTLQLVALKDMKTESGLKGAALGAYRRGRQDDLKQWMNRQLGGVMASSQWTGHSMRVNKDGNRLTFTLVACDGAPAMTDEEMCKRLGITVDQLNKVKEGQGQPIAPGVAAKLGQGALSV